MISEPIPKRGRGASAAGLGWLVLGERLEPRQLAGLGLILAGLAVIDGARHSLDIQYYVWFADGAGQLLMARVIAAADRGVKVRMLFDDLNTMLRTMGSPELRDAMLARVDAHPHIEVRVFNAWRERSWLGRLGEGITDFARINRRMHNKQLIADNRTAILGGRNIGDEYMGLNPAFNFHDLDVLGVGPVADMRRRSCKAAAARAVLWAPLPATPRRPEYVSTRLVTKKPAVARSSEMLKPITKAVSTTSTAPVAKDRNFKPKPAPAGSMPSAAPRTVSPNSPPRPKAWVQSAPGTSVAA